MSKTTVGKTQKKAQSATRTRSAQGHKRPSWVPASVFAEEELCPDCFKAVGDRSRYKLICMLGKEKGGMTVSELTLELGLRQPTVTHHLQVLRSLDAVSSTDRGRERVYALNPGAHCFKECKIPF